MKRILVILVFCLMISACGIRYSEDDVNATVSAKIVEMAGRQKVYVTQETVVVKEYVLVTPTVDIVGAVIAEQQSTAAALPTALPYDYYDADMIAQELTRAGFDVRRFFFELSKDETNNISTRAISSTNFTLGLNGAEYDGRIFRFDDPAAFETVRATLQSEPSTQDFFGNYVIPYENVIIELNGTIPAEIADRVKALFSDTEQVETE